MGFKGIYINWLCLLKIKLKLIAVTTHKMKPEMFSIDTEIALNCQQSTANEDAASGRRRLQLTLLCISKYA